MFREKYKAMVDCIDPNTEIIDNVFKKAEEEVFAKPASRYSFGRKYGIAVAAVLVVSAAAISYPCLQRATETPHPLTDSDMAAIVQEEKINNNKPVSEAATEEAVTGNTAQKRTKIAEVENYNKNFSYSSEEENKKEQPTQRSAVIPQTEVKSDESEPVKEYRVLTEELHQISDGELNVVCTALYDKFGKTDADTGNEFSFEIYGKFTADEVTFYTGVWKWYVNGNKSTLTEFALSGDLNEMYECIRADNKLIWNTENNLLKNNP